MMRTAKAVLVAMLAATLVCAVLWRAVSVPPAVPPVAVADAPATQRISVVEMPVCVLGHVRRNFEETRPECRRCDSIPRPTLADVVAGKSGECADISGGTLNVIPGLAGVNLRCSRLRDVTITADVPINGLDLSYANLRAVSLKGDNFNTVMTCADVRLGAWEGSFSDPAFGGLHLFNVDLSEARLTNIRAAHAQIAPIAWPNDTAGPGANARISFQRASEAGTLLPLDATLSRTEDLARLTRWQSLDPLAEMARRVDAGAKPQIDARIKTLQAGRWKVVRRMFASSVWHGLCTIGGIWELLMMIFLYLIIIQRNRSPQRMAIACRGTGAVPWVSPPLIFSGRVTTAGLAALKGLLTSVELGVRRIVPGAPLPPGLLEKFEGLRLQGAAAACAWIGTIATLAVFALLGSKVVFGQ